MKKEKLKVTDNGHKRKVGQVQPGSFNLALKQFFARFEMWREQYGDSGHHIMFDK